MQWRRVSLYSWIRIASAVFVVIFGMWTVLSNAMLMSRRTFDELTLLAPLVPIAAAALLFFLFRDHAEFGIGSADDEVGGDEGQDKTSAFPNVLIGAALAALFAFAHQYLLFWALTVLFLAISYWRNRLAPTMGPRVVSQGLLNRAAFLIAVGVAVLTTLVVNRPNVDQTLSIDMAVSMLDNPGKPIYFGDTMHGLTGAYILPTYRVESFEPLAALLTRVLGLWQPIRAFQLLLAPLFAIFSVCAAAVLLGRLIPRWWGLGTLVLVGLLLVLRGVYTTYGNFAFVRMSEGKGPFLTGLVPLIAAYAMDFSRRPKLGTWILLLLATISSIGLTANALYAAPMATGFALAASWRPSWNSARRLLVGLLTALYPVSLALMLRGLVFGAGLNIEAFQQFIPIDEAAKLVMGDGWTLWFWLLTLVSGWSLLRSPAIRQWVLAFCLAFVLINMNPFLDRYWGQYVTTKFLTWRLLWPIPLSVFLSVVVTVSLTGLTNTSATRKLTAVLVLLGLATTLAVDRPWVDPVVRDLRFGRKVPHPEYDVAARLNEIAGSKRPVLAPESVAEWMPTMRHNAYPLVSRSYYFAALMQIYAKTVDVQNLRERLILTAYVDGASPDVPQAESLLQEWLAQRRLDVVAVPEDFPQMTTLSQILGKAGFSPRKYLGFVIFR